MKYKKVQVVLGNFEKDTRLHGEKETKEIVTSENTLNMH